MAAPSYSTDLTNIGTGDEASGWIELTGTVNGEAYGTQGAPAYSDPDYPFIQGLYSVTQDCTKDASVGSLAAPTGTSITIPTDGAVLVWHNYMVASNIGTYAEGGLQVCIGTDATNFHVYYTGGVDKSPYPYGGWCNHAATTAVTSDGSVGTVSTIDYVGSAVFVTTGSSKGEVHNVDAIRYGRCSAIFEFGDVTNGYCTFSGFATKNDYNDVTNGYNRWGLLQNTSGGYLWKGRMSIGTATNAADFRDSNKTIFVDWTPKVTANFNLIEVINASTNLVWSGITIQCLDTTTASRGRFLMTDDANVDIDSSTFIDMDTFVFSKSTNTVTIDDTTFTRCGQVTTGGGTFTKCAFNRSPAAISVVTSNLDELVDCTFISDGSNHAVELTSIGGGSITWNCNTSGYQSGSTGSPVTTTSTGNEDIYITAATSSDVTINVASGSSIPSIRKGASFTGNVNVVAGQVTTTITVRDKDTKAPIQNARVYVYADTGGGLAQGTVIINKVLTDVNGQVTDTRSLSSNQPILGRARYASGSPFYKTEPIADTISSTNGLNLNIYMIKDE